MNSWFQLKKHNTTIRQEIIAGLTTFSTMVYIIFVNPHILKETGMDFDAVMVATILASAFASLGMGLFANYPFALAPSMGLNAYFAYGIVLEAGHPWETALGACFLAGLAFLVLTLSGFRQHIMHAIPSNLRIATAAGIGIFLAFIGLQSVNLIVPHSITLVSVGRITSPEILLTGLGVTVIAILMTRQIRGAIFLSSLLNWGIGLALGLTKWEGFVALPPSIAPTFLKLDIVGALQPAFIPIILSFIFVALFDVAGTLISLAEQGKLLDSEGKLPRAKTTLINDATGTAVGSLLGTSPLTTYLESASGIAAGGRTGLTAVVVAVMFLLALFFAPFAGSIPAFATAPALIIVGALMTTQIQHLQWNDPSEFIPAFVTLIAIPLTFSIAIGIGLGFVTYPVIKLFCGKHREIHWLVWVIALLFTTKFILT